jgi:hypothetical protein
MRDWKHTCLIIFALLDAILLGRFIGSVFHTGLSRELPVLYQALCIARPIFIISLGFSAFGLIVKRKWGFILSYVQFPLRFVFVFLSFGFLSLLMTPRQGAQFINPMIIIAMVLEAFRLVTTIMIHLRITNELRATSNSAPSAKSEAPHS